MATPADKDRFARVIEAFGGKHGTWAGELELVIDYLTRLPSHDDFAYLPALLPDSHRLPLSDMYVELRVSKGGLTSAHDRLSDRVVDDWVEERRRVRDNGRMSVEEALDRSPHRRFVILGDPGGGKSSLLRRIARDIAEQKWDKWFIPLYVSLPHYWREKKQYPHLVKSLFEFACIGIPALGRAVPMEASSEHSSSFLHWAFDFGRNLPGMLTDERRRQELRVAFLFDGLDEIAGDPDARNDIARNLQALNSNDVSWIVASRRTGLFQDLGDDIRYDILDLDRDGVEQLVGNWFRSLPQERCPDPVTASTRMVDELAAETRLLSMARNPYLCMLLCYLRAQSDRPLPTNRAAIYQAIIDAARRQLQHRANDETVFNLKDLDRLGALCHDLYGGTPRHLFSGDDWYRLFNVHLTRQSVYLRSRLVDRWGDSESNYHLTHLTLHEYLIARHLAQAGFQKELAEHLHDPPWRMVWRFLTSRLWVDGRHEEAVGLVRRLLEEIDLLGLVYVEAAHLLAEMDPRRALEVLGRDLQLDLWGLWQCNEPILAEAAGAALAILDPEFCLHRLREVIASPVCDREQDGGAQLYRLARHGAPIEVVPAIRAIALLGEIKRPEAVDFLVELLSDTENDRLGLQAAETLATIDDRRLRHRILDLLDTDNVWLWRRFVDLAGQSRHPDYLPRLIDALPQSSGDDLQEVCEALARYASAQAFPALTERWALCDEPEERASLAEALAACCGAAGRGWVLDELGGDVTENNSALWYSAVAKGLVDPEQLSSILTTSHNSIVFNLVEALGDFADQGGQIAKGFWNVLRNFCEEDDERAVAFSALAKVALSRVALLQERDIAPFVAAARYSDHPQRAEAARVVVRFMGPERKEMIAAALDPAEDVALRVSVITSLTESGRMGVDTPLLEPFVVLLDDLEPQVAEAAADAIAAYQPQLLVAHQHKRPARMALARHCAERGILVFRNRIVGAR